MGLFLMIGLRSDPFSDLRGHYYPIEQTFATKYDSIRIDEGPLFGREDYDKMAALGWNAFWEEHYEKMSGRPFSHLVALQQYGTKIYNDDLKICEERGVPVSGSVAVDSVFMAFSLSRTLIEFTKDLRQVPDKVEKAMQKACDGLISKAPLAAFGHRLEQKPALFQVTAQGQVCADLDSTTNISLPRRSWAAIAASAVMCRPASFPWESRKRWPQVGIQSGLGGMDPGFHRGDDYRRVHQTRLLIRMTEPQILKDIPFRADIEFLKGRLRIREEGPGLGRFLALIDQAQRIGRPKAMYRPAYIEDRSEEAVKVEGRWLQSRVLTVNLRQAHRIFFYVATCGLELDEWSKGQNDALKTFWAGSIKEAAVRCAVKAVAGHLEEHYHPGKTSQQNPGSLEDFPLAEQRALFDLLGDTRAAVGVSLLPSLMMSPSHSVSGIIFPFSEDFQSCLLCPREKCPGRRAPYDPFLYQRKYAKRPAVTGQ
jgi:hypothetical protein